jgi:hypothetical protein
MAKRDRQSSGSKKPLAAPQKMLGGPQHPGANASPGTTVPIGTSAGLASGRGGPSKYNELAGPQPPNTIRDVDPGNWYSPFQPIMPFGPPAVSYPRSFDYQTGINLDYAPYQFQKFDMLIAMSRSWGLLRAVIETRKDQLLRMPHAFQVKGKPNGKSPAIDKLNEFFRKPDGKTRYGTWMRLLLEDLLVIDAPTIYKWKSLDGTPLALQVLNGQTIKPLIDDTGRRPDAPSPAFQQIIKGLPMTNFDETELAYMPMRPTPQFPIYGYSPVEQIYGEVIVGIKRLMYQRDFWTDGSMPELIITVPEMWTPQQTAQFQAHFDALMSGNISLKSKVRFVPGGMKPFDIKNANGDALKGDIDEWWASLVCFAFSISRAALIKPMNRASAESAKDTADEEGLHPLMTWVKEEVMDPIIQEDFGFSDIEFNYLPENEVDGAKQMTTITGYVKSGVWTRDEGREASGKEPMGGAAAELAFDTASGPVPLEEAMEAARQTALAKPDELERQAENHELGVQGQQKALDAPDAPPPGKGPPGSKKPGAKEVGKSAVVPFAKARDVKPLSRRSRKVTDAQSQLEEAVAGMFDAMAPAISASVASAVGDAVANQLGRGSSFGEIEVPARALQHIADEVTEGLDLGAFNGLVEPMEKALAEVGSEAAGRGASQLRLEVGPEFGALTRIVHRDALAYATARSAEMVGMIRDAAGDLVPNPRARMAITDTTRQRIRELVVSKLSPGEPFNLVRALEDLKDDVSGGPLFSRTRAALIAQAELGMAHSHGTMASLRRAAELGLTIHKRWSTAKDEKVCSELCEANEAAGAIPLEDAFPSGDLAPLAHPRCRCALVGVVQDEDQEEAA